MGVRTQEEKDLLAFPVMAALARKPMSAREISRLLKISRSAIYVRLRELRDQNLVVQRADDRKWVPIVRVKYERPEEQVREPHETAPVEPPAPSGEDFGREPTPATQVAPPKQYKPHETAMKHSSAQAQRVAKHFRVPPKVDSQEASMGALGLCSQCKKPTPLKYGNVSICPICARKDL